MWALRLITPRRFIVAFLIIGVLCIVYVRKFTLLSEQDLCQPIADIQNNLLRLAALTDNILTSNNITHFLCYGTLWGALRYEKLLPWKRDFDFCVITEDLLWRMDESYLRRLFRLRGVQSEYSNVGGVYTIWDTKLGKGKGTVKMYVFEEAAEEKQMRRVGLSRLVPVSADSADAFPMRLLTPPLNTVRLRGVTFPIPREGVEIQKYHYKDNWWIEMKPKDC